MGGRGGGKLLLLEVELLSDEEEGLPTGRRRPVYFCVSSFGVADFMVCFGVVLRLGVMLEWALFRESGNHSPFFFKELLADAAEVFKGVVLFDEVEDLRVPDFFSSSLCLLIAASRTSIGM